MQFSAILLSIKHQRCARTFYLSLWLLQTCFEVLSIAVVVCKQSLENYFGAFMCSHRIAFITMAKCLAEWPIRSHLVSHFLNYSYIFLFANHKHFKIGTNMSRIQALSASRARGCKHTRFCCSNPFMVIHSHTLHFIV